ncbi:MAG: hypothetical protein HYR85_16965, partial [Planctomycetes bacterium]|nr:hypothetical protein [Planctomycetota bacterium]
MASGRPLLGQILKEMGAVSEEQVQEALTYQYQKGAKIGQALVALGHTDSAQVSRALAKQASLPFVNLDKGVIPPDVIASVPVEVAREHAVVPVKRTGNKLIVAFADPLFAFQLDHLRFVLGLEVSGAIAEDESLRRALKKYYDVEPAAPASSPASATTVTPRTGAVAEAEDEDAPIIRLVT